MGCECGLRFANLAQDLQPFQLFKSIFSRIRCGINIQQDTLRHLVRVPAGIVIPVNDEIKRLPAIACYKGVIPDLILFRSIGLKTYHPGYLKPVSYLRFLSSYPLQISVFSF
jgi:hypothetical protein